MACRSNFGQIGPCRRHNIEDDVAVCVGLSRHLPDFPYGDEIFSKTNTQLINNGQIISCLTVAFMKATNLLHQAMLTL
jgi:hypothetical protein